MSAPSSAAETALPVVLLPAALPDPGFVTDAQRNACARTSAFSRLVRRHEPIGQSWPDEAVPPELGHERWLRRHAGFADDEAVAACAGFADGVAAQWRIDPVHLHVGLDHLVLTDPAGIEPTVDEATGLAAAIAPLLAGEGLALATPHPGRWYLTETAPDRPLRVETRSLLAAVGRSIDAYLPRGDDARRWKRLLNEVQMTWFEHPVNRGREARGLPPINGLWLEGRCPPRGATAEAIGRLATLRGEALETIAAAQAPGGPLIVAGRLLAAQIAGDPQRWVEGWTELERTLFQEIAEMSGRFERGARLVLCSDSGWREMLVRPSDRWRVWRRADPAALLAAPASGAATGRSEVSS